MTTENARWHVDGKIPLVAVVINVVVFAYFMGGLNERVENIEKLLQSRESEIARLARIETRLESLKEQISRLSR